MPKLPVKSDCATPGGQLCTDAGGPMTIKISFCTLDDRHRRRPVRNDCEIAHACSQQCGTLPWSCDRPRFWRKTLFMVKL